MARRGTRRLAVLGAALALTLTSTAGTGPSWADGTATEGMSQSGTLLFIKNHNLWMARGDGSGQVQLTTDGTGSSPYASPSMADNGRFAASKGDRFVVWHPDGTVAADWVPSRLFTTPTHGSLVWENDPADPVLSPDGQRIAYMQSRAVNIGGRLTAEVFSGFSSLGAGGGLFEIVNASDPAWLTSTKAMMSRWSIGFHTVGSGTSMGLTEWFTGEDLLDGSYAELSGPALSPDRRTIAVEGLAGDQLFFGRVTGDPRSSTPPSPTLVCALSEEEPVPEPYLSHFEGPDFGPENDSAVYEQWGDTWRIDNINACEEGATLTKIVPGGSEPDWSPVAYAPPTLGTPPPGNNPPPGTQPPGTQPPGTQPPGTQPPGGTPGTPGPTKVALKGKPKLKGKARVGGTLRVKLGRTTPGKVSRKYTWFRNGKKIKGATKPKLRLTRADRGRKLSVKVVLTAKGRKKLVVRSKSVKVRR